MLTIVDVCMAAKLDRRMRIQRFRTDSSSPSALSISQLKRSCCLRLSVRILDSTLLQTVADSLVCQDSHDHVARRCADAAQSQSPSDEWFLAQVMGLW